MPPLSCFHDSTSEDSDSIKITNDVTFSICSSFTESCPERSHPIMNASVVPSSKIIKYEKIENTQTAKSVQFTRLHIRTYPCILGNHPCCTSGPPISLGWDHLSHQTVTIDDYEESRSRQKRRSRGELRLSCEERRDILLNTERKDRGMKGCNENSKDRNTQEQLVYTAIDLKRAERRIYRERACNRHSQRNSIFDLG